MTGAGSAELLFGKTNSFLGSLSTADTYYEPGIDPNVTEGPTLSRNTEQYRKPTESFHDQSAAQNIEGSFSVDFVVEDTRIGDVHDILFNDYSTTGNILDGTQEPATSRWYFGLDYISGTAERVALGCIPESVDVEYQQGEGTRYSVTFAYADEEYDTSITSTGINEATGDTVQFHSTEISFGGLVQSKEQSATLSMENIARLQYGSGAVADDVTIADPTASLDLETIFTETDQLELAYGGTGQTSTSDRMSAVDASLTLKTPGGTQADYTLKDIKPDEISWNSLLDAGTDTTESHTLPVNGVELA